MAAPIVTSGIREKASRWVAVEQCPFVLGLSSENGELLLDEWIQVTEGNKTRERHIFLFCDVIFITKLKPHSSYRVKHRVSLEDVWLYGFEDEREEEDGEGEIHLKTSLVLAWPISFCVLSFRSLEVKERWIDTLHRRTKEGKERAGYTSQPPGVLMKVLSSSVAAKTLTGGGMEPLINFPLDGEAKISSKQCNQDDRGTQPIENASRWSILRKLRGSKLTSMSFHSEMDNHLFGRPLSKTCPKDGTLPKPITEMLVLLWKKGPTTEGVFRKTGNSKNLKIYREQLNCGEDVDMENLPVVILVGLLKSFLKDLPGNLLVSELYEVWMKALETEDIQQRSTELRRVADKLPGPNVLLLQCLLCVLHHISENSEANKMDAYNLAVCIAPTLLHKDSTLDEQKEQVDKVTKLSQFLIKHCYEVFGENIQSLLGDPDEENSDSVFSQQHDSAYDSTDPDGGDSMGSTQGEGGGSSPSLLFSGRAEHTAVPSYSSDTIFHTFTKLPFSRRCSEPTIFPSAEVRCVQGLARSHDDFSVERTAFEDQPLKKQISNDSFLRSGRGGAPGIQKLGGGSSTEIPPFDIRNPGNATLCSSSCSLESAASNQSEGSVFTSSPRTSPAYPHRAQSTRHTSPRSSCQTLEAPGVTTEVKRHSQSVRANDKVPMRTKSLGPFSRSRGSLKDPLKDKPFPCETLQEDSQSEAEPGELSPRPRPLSAIEVFQRADSRLPSRPPSYEQAVQSAAQPTPPHYRSMTVQDASRELRRSRPASMNENFLSTCPVNQYTDCFYQDPEVNATRPEQSVTFRQRAMSESVSHAHHDTLTRRCSQPFYEEYACAKETYV
ncbi:T cell activation RhoGTPase activating protein b isoform X1 [Hypomesus transpacificus]|uniref:T cell activation RhoGTPase activating protein b isoform X1 n=1 Tax=Hypomesus transpacificus TaxID=137520 RepID=UPI001F0838EC|nr:T cell activation RhoGTPase activating protein b isoform X1 [Hypomesus transpacificus]